MRFLATLVVLSVGGLLCPAAPSFGAGAISVRIGAIRDTVIAHQTAWVVVRITNGTDSAARIPFRSGKIVAEWQFEAESGETLVPWPQEEQFENAEWLTIEPGETLYEVMSPESCFGVFTGYGSQLVRCRAGGVTSDPLLLVRRPAGTVDPPSALRAVGPLHGSGGRDRIQVGLWSLCAAGGAYFDCDEALFTVAWDRMQVVPAEAQAIVDTLIARAPGSGWCRPALHELAMRLPAPLAVRYLEGVVRRSPGGVAEHYAGELLRRISRREFRPKSR